MSVYFSPRQEENWGYGFKPCNLNTKLFKNGAAIWKMAFAKSLLIIIIFQDMKINMSILINQ